MPEAVPETSLPVPVAVAGWGVDPDPEDAVLVPVSEV